MLQTALDLAHTCQHLVHGLFVCVCHFIVKLQHFLLRFKIFIERSTQNIPDGFPAFQTALLVQIAYLDLSRPGDLPVVGQQVVCNKVEERRFSFPVGSYQADVFPFFQFKGNVFQNLAAAEGMAYVADG